MNPSQAGTPRLLLLLQVENNATHPATPCALPGSLFYSSSHGEVCHLPAISDRKSMAWQMLAVNTALPRQGLGEIRQQVFNILDTN